MAATAWMPTVGNGSGRALPRGARDASRSVVAPEARPPGRKVAVPPGPGSAPRALGRGARAKWRPHGARGFCPCPSPGRRREGAVGAGPWGGRAIPGSGLRRGRAVEVTAAAGPPRPWAAAGARVAHSAACERRARKGPAVPGTVEPPAESSCRAPAAFWPYTCPQGFTALNHSETQALSQGCHGDAGFCLE